LRAFTVADYDAAMADRVVRLWRSSFEHGVGIVDPHPLEQQRRALVDEVVPQHRVRVACRGREIVGFLASRPEVVGHLYVAVDCIGQGIGSHLLALAKAESAGSLWLFTFARNHRARRFYERQGFREVERESQNMFRLEAIRYRWERDAPATTPP
jgi:ribosomal protein S18 acetylase RimI-like enzyme